MYACASNTSPPFVGDDVKDPLTDEVMLLPVMLQLPDEEEGLRKGWSSSCPCQARASWRPKAKARSRMAGSRWPARSRALLLDLARREPKGKDSL